MSEIDIYKHIGQQMISDREKIKELEERINKAIEYIDENVYIDYYGTALFRKQKNVDELLNILRGDE